MNDLCWQLVHLVCGALKMDEREALLGDFAECKEPVFRALGESLGLVMRRQCEVWLDWRPWLAMIGVAAVVAVPLSQLSARLILSVWWQIHTYRKYGVRTESGLTVVQDVAIFACLSLAVFLFSWTAGFVLGALSGRAVWLTGTIFYLVLMISGWVRHFPRPEVFFHLVSPFRAGVLFFLIAAFWGVFQGVRSRSISLAWTLALAFTILALTVLLTWMDGWTGAVQEVWTGGALHGPPWYARLLPLALLSWPVYYMVVAAARQSGHWARAGDAHLGE